MKTTVEKLEAELDKVQQQAELDYRNRDIGSLNALKRIALDASYEVSKMRSSKHDARFKATIRFEALHHAYKIVAGYIPKNTATFYNAVAANCYGADFKFMQRITQEEWEEIVKNAKS